MKLTTHIKRLHSLYHRVFKLEKFSSGPISTETFIGWQDFADSETSEANIIPQDFNLRIDFYDDVDGLGNFVFSLREHVSSESLSAGVFRERLVNMDGFIGESILNGSAKIFLEGTKSFEVEVIGFNIKIYKIAR